jgi:hypothetical protein
MPGTSPSDLTREALLAYLTAHAGAKVREERCAHV